MKTLLLPENLANEKRGGLCKTPHAVVLRRNTPPTLAATQGNKNNLPAYPQPELRCRVAKEGRGENRNLCIGPNTPMPYKDGKPC